MATFVVTSAHDADRAVWSPILADGAGSTPQLRNWPIGYRRTTPWDAISARSRGDDARRTGPAQSHGDEALSEAEEASAGDPAFVGPPRRDEDAIIATSDVLVADDGAGNALLTFSNGEQLSLQGVSPSEVCSKPHPVTTGIPCFTPGIRIATARGAVPVEQIVVGDLLQTADNGYQPVIWTGRRDLSARTLAERPHLRPIAVSPGGLLCNDRRLLVSPQHRFMLGRRQLGDLASEGEAFLRARLLPQMAGARAETETGCEAVSYIHLMTEQHQVIFAEGVATESFWPGPEAIRGLSAQDRRELLDLFPELVLARDLCGAFGRRIVADRYAPLARRDLGRASLEAISGGAAVLAANDPSLRA